MIEQGQATPRVVREYSDATQCWKDEQSMIRIFWKLYGRENSWNHSYVNNIGNRIWSRFGTIVSDEERKKNSDAQILAHQNPETKKKHKLAIEKYYSNPENLE